MARILVGRFNEGVIAPTRGFLSQREASRKALEKKHAEQAEELRQDDKSDLENLNKARSSILSTIEHVRNKARSHLEEQKVSANDERPANGIHASEAGGDEQQLQKLVVSQVEDASFLAKKAEADSASQILQQKRPSEGGINDGGGCVAAIFCTILWFIVGSSASNGTAGFICALIVYLGIQFLRNVTPTSAMENGWRDLNENMGKINQQLDGALQAARKRHSVRQEALKTRHLGERDAETKKWQASLESLTKRLAPVVAEIKAASQNLAHKAGWSCLAWKDPAWDGWTTLSAPSFCASFGTEEPTIGDIEEEFPNLALDVSLPAFFPFAEGHGIMMVAGGDSKNNLAKGIATFVLRLLAVIPPGKARFTFVDPVGLGNNVAGLMSLADHDEMIVNSRAWSEPRHIEQRLSEITEHMETVIQKYLRQDYKTIHDYNANAGEVAESHRFVVVFDFPTNFNDTSARRLVSIAQNGPRCGVYPIVLVDSSKPLPHGFALEELERHAMVVKSDRGRWRVQEEVFKDWAVGFEEPPSLEMASLIKNTVGAAAKSASRVEVPFARLLQLAGMSESNFWKASSAKKIEIPLGPEGAKKARHLSFGEGTAHHGLIVGRTGSGKSNLMHIIVTSLALKYSPKELQLYLIDFKQGVEFKPYADHGLPHAFAIAVESEREFALSVMERLELELKNRGDLFRKTSVANISEYREKTAGQGDHLPRILLLVDEFQEFFREDDQLSRRVAAILNQLVLQGRSNGIHVLLGTQSLSNVRELSRGTFDQMGVRIALQCSEADSRMILADDNPAARLLSRPGEAIYNDQAGLIEGNKPFQVAMFDKESDGESILQGLRNRAVAQAEEEGRPLNKPVIFSGNELAHLEEAKEINALIDQSAYVGGSKSLNLWLGEPVAIRPTTCARLTRQSGSHLMVVALNEEESAGMVLAALCSVLAQRSPDEVRIVVANFFVAETPAAELVDKLPELFPHPIVVVNRQRDLANQVKALAAEVKRRGNTSAQGPSVLLFLFGLQRMKPMREDDDSVVYDDTSELPSTFFAQLIKEGAENGIHIIAACDTVGNASRCLDRRLMSQVSLRVAASMSESDSSTLLDAPAASRLNKPHRAIFFDESHPGVLEKFIPFGLPQPEFLQRMAAAIREREELKAAA